MGKLKTLGQIFLRKRNFSRIIPYIRQHGVKRLFAKVREKALVTLRSGAIARYGYYYDQAGYEKWIANHEPSKSIKPSKEELTFDIIVPLYRTDKHYAQELVESVRSQTYSKWRLLASGSELSSDVAEYFTEMVKVDKRIVFTPMAKNAGIAGNTNNAVASGEGEYLLFLDHDDTIAPNALEKFSIYLSEHLETEVVYSDEDKITEKGKRFQPNFKPDFSPNLLNSHNYITHPVIMRRKLFNDIGGLRSGTDGVQDYDLLLRASEKTDKFGHIPMVLYHWRAHSASTADWGLAKDEITERTLKVVAEHLERIGRPASVSAGAFIGASRIRYETSRLPKISIIIPNKNSCALLKQCLESVLGQTTYTDYEIIIVDNNSDEPGLADYYRSLRQNPLIKILNYTQPFNYSAINNLAAKESTGEVLLFLNNDTKLLTPDWLEEMYSLLQWPEVGAAGAKLIYPNDTVQHYGIALGIGRIAGHPQKHYPAEVNGYFGRLSVVQDVSAVTGACLMTKRKDFEAVGGFDERMKVAYNDIDYCLKLRKKGLSVLVTPYAKLIHFESISRGLDDTKEKIHLHETETKLMLERWDATLKHDPFYSPNLSKHREDMSIDDGN